MGNQVKKIVIIFFLIFIIYPFFSYSHVNHYEKIKKIEMDVLRNGKKIGYNKKTFKWPGDDDLEVFPTILLEEKIRSVKQKKHEGKTILEIEFKEPPEKSFTGFLGVRKENKLNHYLLPKKLELYVYQMIQV